jgi:nucleotide-binding universal stress UspA family protein
MDPISLIVAAVVAGASTAAREAAGTAVKDAYGGLKELIRRRFGGDQDAEAQLEQAEQNPEGDHTQLKDRLLAEGADRDEELLAAARALLEQADPDGVRAGKYGDISKFGGVNISGGKGIVVGDRSTVTMTFDERD